MLPESLERDQRERAVRRRGDVWKTLMHHVERDLGGAAVEGRLLERAVAVPRVVSRDELQVPREPPGAKAIPPEASQRAVACEHRLGAQRRRRGLVLDLAPGPLAPLFERSRLVSPRSADL